MSPVQGWILLLAVIMVAALLAFGGITLIARGEKRPKDLQARSTSGRAMGAGFVNFDDFMRGRQPTAIVASEMATVDGEAETRLGGADGEPAEDEPI